jgi:hypothetical protein
MFKEVTIERHERGLRYRDGHFIAPLPPGRHTVFSPKWDEHHERIEVIDTTKVRFTHPQLDELLKDHDLRGELLVVEVEQDQRALVFKDERLFAVLTPGRHTFWRAAGEMSAEVYNWSFPRFAHRKLDEIMEHADGEKWFDGMAISA